MAAAAAPCAWEPIECGCDLGLGEGAEQTVDQQYAIETAAYVLWALSGRQFGACEISVRPCRRDCASGLDGGPWGARLVDGNWINLSCRSCSGPCACSEVCEVRLPEAPVNEVLQVIIDGVEVAEDLWRLEDNEWLVVSPPAGCFPDCQDMSAALGEAGTSGVIYTIGVPPPTAGRRAVGALACEILKACQGGDCQLPKRTQVINRQGISFALIDPMTFFDQGKTGIYEVDLFLSAANPLHRMAGARVMSPDYPPRRHDAGVGFESS